MMQQLVFLSGVPRSGSTLLCNLLAQNPAVAVTPTSGLIDVVKSVRNVCDQSSVWRSMPEDERNRHKVAMVRGVLGGRFNGHTGLCVDKNRGWPGMFEFMATVLGGREHVFAIICVRDLRDVLASFEKLFRRTAALSETPQQRSAPVACQTARGRAEYLMRDTEPVGFGLASLADAVSRGWRDRMHFVEYDSLCRAPRAVLAGLYRFLGAPFWDHDFDNVSQVTREDDSVHGFHGLHTIRPAVRPQDSQWPIVFDPLVTGTPFWHQITASARFWEAFGVVSGRNNGHTPEKAEMATELH